VGHGVGGTGGAAVGVGDGVGVGEGVSARSSAALSGDAAAGAATGARAASSRINGERVNHRSYTLPSSPINCTSVGANSWETSTVTTLIVPEATLAEPAPLLVGAASFSLPASPSAGGWAT